MKIYYNILYYIILYTMNKKFIGDDGVRESTHQ